MLDSRPLRDGRAIRRRRQCEACQHRYTTYEYVEETALVVAKSDSRREPFDPKKLIQSIQKACAKRPISTAQIEETAEKVERKLARGGDREVSSRTIGELVMKQLRELDDVAYVRFASVYRDFQDRAEFLRELQAMETGTTTAPPKNGAPE